MIIMTRATGWSERYIKWMPLKVLFQYVHAWLVQEGTATEWTFEDGDKRVALRGRIDALLRADDEVIARL